MPNWHHEVIAQALERVASGKDRRLMIFMPPRNGKSELASVKFPAWFLGRKPEKKVICCSYSAELAEDFGRYTRDQVEMETHKMCFPKCILRKGSKSATKWKVSNRGGFTGTGVGGSITGAGADVLIIDDPIKNREEAESPTVRRKIWEWYTSTAFTRLEKGGAVIVILTRWHDDDLAGRLLELEGEKGQVWDKESGKWITQTEFGGKTGKWNVVKFPAIATENEQFRKEGEALWPDKYDLEDLMEIKAAVGVRDWAALYQQDPVIEGGNEFKVEWFKTWDKLPPNLRYVTTVDLAVSKNKKADESVVMTTAMDMNQRIYVIEYKNWKANPSEVMDEIYRQQGKYSSTVGMEAVGYQQSMMHFMRLEGAKRGKYLHVQPISTRSNKEEKIRGLIPFYSNGLVYHPQNDKDTLEEQLIRFPNAKHDDVIDAFSMAIPMLQRPNVSHGSDPTKEMKMRWGRDGLPML